VGAGGRGGQPLESNMIPSAGGLTIAHNDIVVRGGG